jgi:hypothetical protein
LGLSGAHLLAAAVQAALSVQAEEGVHALLLARPGNHHHARVLFIMLMRKKVREKKYAYHFFLLISLLLQQGSDRGTRGVSFFFFSAAFTTLPRTIADLPPFCMTKAPYITSNVWRRWHLFDNTRG